MSSTMSDGSEDESFDRSVALVPEALHVCLPFGASITACYITTGSDYARQGDTPASEYSAPLSSTVGERDCSEVLRLVPSQFRCGSAHSERRYSKRTTKS